MKEHLDYMAANAHAFQDWLASAIDYYKQSGTLPPIPQPPLTAHAVTAATRPNLDQPVKPAEQPVVASVTLPANCEPANLPNAPGLVYVLNGNERIGDFAHAILEVADAYPAGSPERAFLLPQIENAQTLSRLEYPATFAPACKPVDPQTGRVTGDGAIPHTMAWTPTSGRDDAHLFYSVASVIAELQKSIKT